MFQKGHKHARGGKRPGSGPKPSCIKALERQVLSEVLTVDVVRNLFTRLLEMSRQADNKIAHEATVTLLNRAFGKPVQPQEHSGADGEPIQHVVVMSRIPKR